MTGTRIHLAIGVCVVAALVVAGVAAGAPAPVKVKGTQTVIDEAKGQYEMQGSLVGKWNVTAFKTNYQGPDGEFVGSGKEMFSGCHDADGNGTCGAGEPTGTLRFSFVYWANFHPKTQALVRGECVHPVTGGTGGFKNVKGIIHMVDRPAGKTVKTTYAGSLLFPGATTASVSSTVTRGLASIESVAGARSCGH
jgi:hypothetical protein